MGYVSFGPIEKYYAFCDFSVREKDWRAASQAFSRAHAQHTDGAIGPKRRYPAVHPPPLRAALEFTVVEVWEVQCPVPP